MGKNKKEHRKKVLARNQKIEQQRKRLQKLYTKMFDEKINELREKYSAETQSIIAEETPVQIQDYSGDTTL